MSGLREWFFLRMLGLVAHVDEPLYSPIKSAVNAWLRFRGNEREVSLGELNGDKTFYVIREFPPSVGLAGWYDRAIGYIARAESKGWIPVIAPPEPDASSRDVGDWYSYFAAPSAYAIDEVMKSRHVVFAVTQAVVHKRYNRREIDRRHRICRLIPPKREIMAFLETRAQEVLYGMPPGRRVGAYYRGTDYKKHGDWRPFGHASVPDAEAWCDSLQEDLSRWGIAGGSADGAGVFIVTEEQEALETIRKRFPDARFVNKERFSNFRYGVCLPQQRLANTSAFENNRLYLLDLFILSKCDYLFGTINGGLMMALNWNGNAYRDVHILDIGVS